MREILCIGDSLLRVAISRAATFRLTLVIISVLLVGLGTLTNAYMRHYSTGYGQTQVITNACDTLSAYVVPDVKVSQVLRYEIVPYRLSGAGLAGGLKPDDMMPVRVLEQDWKELFGSTGPSLFFGFYEGYKYVLVVAGGAELVIKSLGSSEYTINLVLKKVALTYVKVGRNDASVIMRKFRAGKLLGVREAPIESFSKVMLYDTLVLTSKVSVDDKGYTYYNGVFAGTWPFKMPANGLILHVIPKSYFAGSSVMESVLREARASGVMTVYAIEGFVARPASSRIAGAKATSVMLPSGRELGVTTLDIGGTRYIVMDPKPFFTSYVMRYDPKTGLLRSISISSKALEAMGSDIPLWYYSLMLPTPIFNAIGSNAQILLAPLGGNNAVEITLNES